MPWVFPRTTDRSRFQRGETCAKAHTRSSVVDRVCACNVTGDYGTGVPVGVGVGVAPVTVLGAVPSPPSHSGSASLRSGTS
jgi:hypothetical protein